MERVVSPANDYLRSLAPGSVDLVLTSPPAYPSPRQRAGSLGKEGTVSQYVDALGRTLFLARRALRSDGFLVLVVEPLPGYNPMGLLAIKLKRLQMRCLATYHWSSGDGRGSFVIFLTRGVEARLNRDSPAWSRLRWAIPAPPADQEYGFYEWPDGLVEAIVDLTIPDGGRVVDPFAGKAEALSHLGSEFNVTAVDVVPMTVAA